MNRLFLAILALLAGLATQVSTAQARMCTGAETEIGAVQGPRGCVRPSGSPNSRVEQPAAKRDRAARPAMRVKRGSGPVLFPPIYLRADRALE
jgi:hypothetical protein